jgi:hypothetical protein
VYHVHRGAGAERLSGNIKRTPEQVSGALPHLGIGRLFIVVLQHLQKLIKFTIPFRIVLIFSFHEPQNRNNRVDDKSPKG